MSRSMPVTAATPSNDFANSTRRIAPPVIPARSAVHQPGETREVRGETIGIVAVVLHAQQPLLHLAPRREKDTAIVLDQPVQMAQSGVDRQEIPELAHSLLPERHAALGADGHHVPGETVPVDRALQ